MLPEIALELGRQNSVSIPSARLGPEANYVFNGFNDFLDCYHQVGAVVTQADDLSFLAQSYLTRVASEGTLYVEFMLSPDHSIDNGISYHDQIEAVASGIDNAKHKTGIEARLIITSVRHRGPQAAEALAGVVAANPHPKVVGFGLTGNEHAHEVRDFSRAFRIAKDAGLGLTAHAGEWREGQTVRDAIEILKLDRVGHGIRVADSVELLKFAAERGVGFEICLSSNVALGAVADFSNHPIKHLLVAGCRATLATDDPAFFKTSPQLEIERAVNQVGLTVEDVATTVLNGIELAFCDAELKSLLRQRVALHHSDA